MGSFLQAVLLSLLLFAEARAGTTIPAVTLGQDVSGKDVVMPLVGAGTWQYNSSVAYDSVCKSFDAGYTFVDTANGYGNEEGVGQAIQDCWLGKGKAREDLFVMTKIPGGLDTAGVQAAHDDNMKWLQLDYVDHLMTHFPA
jgi:diketogulonate reductase-like aldo/keto reductase